MPMPSMMMNHSSQRVGIKHMRSAAKRSWHECHRVMQIERHWLTRDRHNSAPAVFTNVTSAPSTSLKVEAQPVPRLQAHMAPQFGMPGVGGLQRFDPSQSSQARHDGRPVRARQRTNSSPNPIRWLRANHRHRGMPSTSLRMAGTTTKPSR